MGGLVLTTQDTHGSSWPAVWRLGALWCKWAIWILWEGHGFLLRALRLILNTWTLRTVLNLVNISIQMLVIFPRSGCWRSAPQRLISWWNTAVETWASNSVFMDLHIRLSRLSGVNLLIRSICSLDRDGPWAIVCWPVWTSLLFFSAWVVNDIHDVEDDVLFLLLWLYIHILRLRVYDCLLNCYISGCDTLSIFGIYLF